ncbi:MAG: carboxypeptidase-like regulatory domain-containing protein, partial [Bacteroidota bacterium]
STLFIFIILLSLIQVDLSAGNDKPAVKTVSGKVLNKHGESVAGAEIKIVETGELVYANLEGEFKLQLDPNKNLTVEINTIGFEPLMLSSNKLNYFSELILKEL